MCVPEGKLEGAPPERCPAGRRAEGQMGSGKPYSAERVMQGLSSINSGLGQNSKYSLFSGVRSR